MTPKNKTLIKHLTILSLIAICFWGCLVYSNTFNVPFIFDDYHIIKENPHIRIDRLSWTSFEDIFKGPSPNRPLAHITFAINYYLNGYELPGYHIVNLVIHILTGIFLFLFIKTTLTLPASGFTASINSKHHFILIALSAALIWLVHPVNTQAVTYIVQRMTSMASMFYVLSFLCYARSRILTTNSSKKKHRAYFYMAGCILSGLLAISSKEIAATLPILIFIYEWYFFQSLDSKWLTRQLPWIASLFLIVTLIGLLYLWNNPLHTGNNIFEKILSLYHSGKSLQNFTLPQRLMTELRVIIYYISLFIFPHPLKLHLDYMYPISTSFLVPATTVFSLLAIIGLIFLIACTAKSHRVISFCLVWFFINLLLESSFFGLALIFEHRTYLPFMSLSIMVIVLSYQFLKTKWGAISVAVIICVLSFWTFQRNIKWSDQSLLWKDNITKAPANARPFYAVGKLLLDKEQLDAAIDSFQTAIKLKPDYQKAHIAIGEAFTRAAELDQAFKHYNMALLITPDDVHAINQLGNILTRQGKYSSALAYYEKALLIDPNNSITYNNMGNAYFHLKDLNKAIQFYQLALAQNANSPDAYYNLGVTFTKQHMYKRAIQCYKAVIRLMPNHTNAHISLANLFFEINNIEGAIVHYKKALVITPEDAKACYNLGVAFSRQNDLSNAIRYFHKTLTINPDYEPARQALHQLNGNTEQNQH